MLKGQAEEGRAWNAGDAVGATGQADPVQQHDADDLAEGQRDDGQVVAPQPQHRKAEQHAPEGRQDSRQRQAEPEGKAEILGQNRIGIGPDSVEGDVAKVQQPREPDHDIQPPAEHHIGQHQDPKVEFIAADTGDEGQHQCDGQQRRPEQQPRAGQPCAQQGRAGGWQARPHPECHGEAQHEDRSAEQRHIHPAGAQQQRAARTDIGAEPDHHHEQPEGHKHGLASIEQRRAETSRHERRRHTFSTSCRPSRPVGRKTRVRTRMLKAATSLYCTEK
jgi:hypothetical protein